MTFADKLENLADSGRLKRESPDQAEFDGLVRLGDERLQDSLTVSLSLVGRFELAYGAAHSFALADYGGQLQISEQLYKDLLAATRIARDAVGKLGPVPPCM